MINYSGMNVKSLTEDQMKALIGLKFSSVATSDAGVTQILFFICFKICSVLLCSALLCLGCNKGNVTEKLSSNSAWRRRHNGLL